VCVEFVCVWHQRGTGRVGVGHEVLENGDTLLMLTGVAEILDLHPKEYAKAMALTVPDLKGLYTRIYSDVRWPAPLPRPEDVRFCWNPRFETTSGVCYQKGTTIEVNITYRDPRLSRELEYLVIHEAAHFIWRDHSPAFRAFLRSVGVPQDYILYRGEASPLYRLVQAEQAQRQLRLFG
jgi:SprT-like family protein